MSDPQTFSVERRGATYVLRRHAAGEKLERQWVHHLSREQAVALGRQLLEVTEEAAPPPRPAAAVAPVLFRFSDHTLVGGDEVVELTVNETLLLGVLVKANGRVVEYAALARHVYQTDDESRWPTSWQFMLGFYRRDLAAKLVRFAVEIGVVQGHGYYLHPMIGVDWSDPL